MGDLSEGLAGSPQKAIQMANSAFKAVNKMNLKVPFIMTKGNHDITGPGAKEAFEKVYLPNMARLAGHPSLQSANYTTTLDDVLFVCYDPWDRNPEGLQQLEKSLAGSKATYKFVMLHEPVIPVNERCWHVFRQDNAKRMQLEYYTAFGEKPYDTVNKQSCSVHICIYTPLSVGTLLGDLSFRFSSTVSSKIKIC